MSCVTFLDKQLQIILALRSAKRVVDQAAKEDAYIHCSLKLRVYLDVLAANIQRLESDPTIFNDKELLCPTNQT